MQSNTNITRAISRFAVIVIVFVVLLVPCGYFVISYKHISGVLEAEAEINARNITQIISANPNMWEFEQLRLEEYLGRRPGAGTPEARRIFNLKNRLVASRVDALASPVLTRPADLYDAGVIVGRIEIARSLRPLLVRAGILLLCMLPLGGIVYLVLRILPIRAIQRSEEALQRERDRAQTYLDLAGVILLALDAAGSVSMINRKGCVILKQTEDRILRVDWFDSFVPDGAREAGRAEFFAMLRDAGVRERHLESQVLTGAGDIRTIAWHHTVLRDESGRAIGTLSSGEDITENKRLEAQLRHAQKMEAVGVLAGGIAHDFNNILTAVIGYANMLQIGLSPDNPLCYHVERILQASDRAARLVKSILAYSRKQIMIPVSVSVNGIIREVETLLRRLMGERVELRIVLAENDMTIKADSGQIEQVLMNLAVNARDAMPDGGSLIIETGRREMDDEFIAAHGYGRAGRYAAITVTDTGTGMDEKTREKIFDPFFTTKEVGKGTGLGLSMVYGIIKQHHGYVNVYSEIGRGTTFRIYLPLVDAAVGSRDRPKPHSPAGGSETILIAEDDEAVRTLMATALREAGYSIIEAVDGEDAIAKFAAHKNAIRLAVLDVIMPKKNGTHVFAELKTIRPEIRVLFISGYPSDFLQKQFEVGPETHSLSKPGSATELIRKVREVLDA